MKWLSVVVRLPILAESPALRDFFSLFQLIRFEMDVNSHVLVGRRTLTLSAYLNRTGLISEGLQRTVIRELSYPHRKICICTNCRRCAESSLREIWSRKKKIAYVIRI